MNKQYIKLIGKIIFAGVIVYWLIDTGKLNLEAIIAATSLTSVAGMAVLLGLGYFLASERFRTLLSAFEIPLTAAQSLKLVFVGLFFNFILPGGVGGDLMRAYYIHRSAPSQEKYGALAVIIDRVLGLYTMFLIGTVMIIYDFSHIRETKLLYQFSIVILLGTLVSTVAGVILFCINISPIILWTKKYLPFKNNKLIQSLPILVETFFKSPRIIFRSFILSLGSQVLYMIALSVAGSALGYSHLSLNVYLLIGSLGFLISAIPITPAAVGVGQAAFLFVANSYLGKESNLGPSMITLYQFVSLLWALVGGIVYLRVKSDSFSSIANAEIPNPNS